MPPKKAGVYLADYDDCADFMEQVGFRLNRMEDNTRYMPFETVPQPFFPLLRNNTHQSTAEAAVRGLYAVMDGLEERKEWRVARNGLEMALLDIWGHILQESTAMMILGDAFPFNQKPAYYTIGMNEDENEMLASANFGLAHTPFLKLKMDKNVEHWRGWLPKLYDYCQTVSLKKDKANWPILAPINLGYGSPGSKIASHAPTPLPFIWSIDANADWTPEVARQMLPVLMPYKQIISMVEQPFPSHIDDANEREQWKQIKMEYAVHGFSIYADESVSTSDDVAALSELSHGVNIKLDKTGGVREALRTWHAANELGLGVWIGIMVSSRLSTTMASCLLPLSTLGGDLDGQLLVDVQSDKFQKGLNWDIRTGMCTPPSGYGLGLELKPQPGDAPPPPVVDWDSD